MLKQVSLVGLFISIILIAAANGFCDVQVPNGSFEEGEKFPNAWIIKDGIGAWENTGHTGKRCISLSDIRRCMPMWKSERFLLEGNKFYRLSLWMKSITGFAPLIAIDGFPRGLFWEFGIKHPEWRRYNFYFPVLKETEVSLRFTSYCHLGRLFIDDVSITEVKPVYFKKDGIELGIEERIRDGVYMAGFGGKRFGSDLPDGDVTQRGGPGSRYLFEVRDHMYGGNRWYVGPKGIVFRHKVGEVEQTEATFRFLQTWRPAGTPVALASNDGKNFVELGRERREQDKGKWSDTFQLPAKLFPAREIYIWLRCDPTPGDKGWVTFELWGYEYKAKLAKPVPDFVGKTEFVEVGK